MSYETYAWIIDTDHTYDPNHDVLDDSGRLGPRNINPDLQAQLKAGKGVAFKMYDDDGELYYSGRIISYDGEDFEGFEPLDDFGTPNAGAVRIDYQNSLTKKWEML